MSKRCANGGNESEAELAAWRGRALQTLLLFSTVALLPLLLFVVSGYSVDLTLPVRIVFVALYVTLLVVAFMRSWPLALRTWLFLTSIMIAGVLRLVVGQLEGAGRLTLLLPPLLAVILSTPRSGWIASAICTLLFAVAPVIIRTGWFTAGSTTLHTTLEFWLLQGAFWLVILVTLLLLLIRFQGLQRSTLLSEQQAREQLEISSQEQRRLEKELGRAADTEQQRLGAELHDSLCQHLTAALLHCTAMEQECGSKSCASEDGYFRLRAEIEEAIDQAYEIAHRLAPLSLSPDALYPALERLCREVQRQFGFQCLFETPATPFMANHADATQLYRIVAEALNNVARHSHCTKAVVSLKTEASQIALSISDNGTTYSAAEPPSGLGITIMKYRASMLGGALTVSRRSGGGIEVSCLVPCKEFKS